MNDVKCRFEIIKGPSGSGKTALMTDRVIRDISAGKRVLFLVPDQISATAEFEMSRKFHSVGLPRRDLEIMSFSRLARDFFAKYGGAAGTGSPAVSRRLYLWRAFRGIQPAALKCFAPMQNRAEKFVPLLGDLITEMKKNGVAPSELDREAEASGDDGLGKKLSDIAVIYSAYNRIFEEKGVTDPTDLVARFARELCREGRGEFFDGLTVYMDGFTRFSAPERSVISEILRHGSALTVSLCCDCSESGAAERELVFGIVSGEGGRTTEKRLLRLAGDAGITPVVTVMTAEVPDPGRCAPDIYRLKTEFYADSPSRLPFAANGGVAIYRLPNIYSEAEFAACEIVRAVREEAAECSDFTVIAGSAQSASIVSMTLSKHSIPNHVSVRRELRETRLFRFVLSALAVVRYDWRRDDTLTFIKTGLTGIDDRAAGMLENYVTLWDIRGRREWENDWEMSTLGFSDMEPDEKTQKRISSDLKEINAARRRIFDGLDGFCSELSGGGTVGGACAALYDMLCFYRVGDAAGRSDDPEEAAAGTRLWNQLCAVLDSIYESVGDLSAGSGGALSEIFAEIFETAMSGASAGTVPAMTGEVTVAVFGSHTPHTKRAIILGCNQGQLPPAASSGNILTDAERTSICERGNIELGAVPDDRYYLDNLDFYLSLCVPSVSLTLTCSEFAPDGARLYPSEQFETARRIFTPEGGGDAPIPAPDPAGLPFIRDAVSAREAERLYAGTSLGLSLSEALGSAGEDSAPLCCGKNERIAPEAARGSLLRSGENGDVMEVSPSSIDKYVSCPLKYALSKEAGIAAPPDLEKNRAASTGTILHHVMERYFRDVFDRNGEPPDSAELSRFAGAATDEMLRNVMPAGRMNMLPYTTRLSIESMKNRTAAVNLAYYDRIQRDSHFVPKYFEYRVDGENPVTEAGGVPVMLSRMSRIDRVDVFDDTGEDGAGKRYMRVIDYKSSRHDFKKDRISEGDSLQMFLYLMCVAGDGSSAAYRDAASEGLTPVPAAMNYYTVKSSPRIDDVKDGGDDGKYLDSLKNTLEITGAYDAGIKDKFERVISESTKDKTDLWAFENGQGGDEPSDRSYGALSEAVRQKVGGICGDILSGSAGADPKGSEECGNCDYKPVCRSRQIWKSTADSNGAEGDD